MGDRDSPRRRTGKEPMKTSVAAALAGLAMASSPTLGADLFGTAPPPMTFPDSQSPITEVGTNWYLRGDIGYEFNNEPTVVPTAGLIPAILTDSLTGANYVNAPPGNASSNAGVTRGNNQNGQGLNFDIGVGYRVNNFLRLEATYMFSNGPSLSYSKGSLCPDATTPVSNEVGGTAVPVGYLWAPVDCTGYLHATQINNTALASAYLDLGNFWGITPYIGAGGGLNANTISGSTHFIINADGSPFRGNTSSSGAPNVWVVQTGYSGGYAVYTPLGTQPNVDFGNQNWDRHFSSTHYSMAGALMAGFGYQLSPSATLDVGYKYLSLDLLGSNKSTLQDFRIGIRYMAN
jgi:opacity protein-like surface antigen